MPLALLALAVGAFAIGTTEFVITGLLEEVARSFGVTDSVAGLAATAYALGVVAGAPALALLGTRTTRKQMLMWLMGVFIAGNLLTAVAPTFELLLAGRVIASLAHGAFFGIGAIVAADLVPPRRKAGAIATMFTGLTLATVVGVPAGTFIGQHFGWRTTFLAVAALGAFGATGIAALLPQDPRGHHSHGGIRRELAALRDTQVILAMAMTVLGFGGVFAAITYIAPIMTGAAGFSDGSMPWLLVLFGLGMVAGNLLGGRLADRAPMRMLSAALAGLGLTLALFTIAAHHKASAAAFLVLIGMFGFATVPPLQKRVLDHTTQAPTLASAVNIGAFNLGNALAAWLGGLALSSGLGTTSPSAVGAVLATTALGLALLAGSLQARRGQHPHDADHPHTPARGHHGLPQR
ncbi:MFS transporter [Actinomadura sp. 6N118]|uniref:MFS transporter n=1 Tax=Actinomadura sp. 6N118 TaxID=3375151 RepID=UPI0037B85772